MGVALLCAPRRGVVPVSVRSRSQRPEVEAPESSSLPRPGARVPPRTECERSAPSWPPSWQREKS